MFEKATKLKIRFTELGGSWTTEDIWDLPLVSVRTASLNTLAKKLNHEIKESEEQDFVYGNSSKNDLLNLKFDIVKHIIDVKKKENAKKARKKEITQLRELQKRKQTEKLENLTSEELEAKIKALEEE